MTRSEIRSENHPPVDGANDALLLVAADDTVESHNSSVARILGYGADELIGRNLDELFCSPSEARRFRRTLVDGFSRQHYVDGEARLRSAAGKPVLVGFRALPLSGRAGNAGFALVGRTSVANLANDVQSLALFPQEDPNPVLRVSAEGTLQYANRGSWMLLAHWRTEIGGQIPLDWVEKVHDALESGEVREFELDVGFKTIHLVIVPIQSKGYVNLYGLDVTRRRYAEEKLKLTAQVFENATEGIMITDPDLRIVDVNSAFCDITGYRREEILGEHASTLNSERHGADFYRKVWESAARFGSWQGEVWDRRRNGEVYPKWLSVSAVKDESGALRRFIAIFSDITTLKRSEEQLYHMAHYDGLTGLANRRYFLELLKSVLLSTGRAAGMVGVLFVDLDGFKLVNDTLGHAAGDRLLQEVAERLRECVRSTDTVGRIGGDEFTVILPNLTESQDAAIIVRKLLMRLKEPLRLEAREVLVTASVGIAVYPEDGSNVDALLQCADTAMYRAKESGKNGYQFFSRDMNARAEERLTFLARLRRAIDAKEFIVQYQPLIRLADGSLAGLEALVRWKSPDRGLISPGDFIPAAEEHGMISEIGYIVLREVCRQAEIWRAEGKQPVRIAVNISALQLRQPDFVSSVEAILAEFNLPPSLLELELTERVMVVDDSETVKKLKQLKDIGLTLTIDDFGTKYSSLAYLKRFPIDRLKIDRTFIQDLSEESGESEIASVIVAMGKSLRMDVVAEGVETKAQAERLVELGCPSAQGYFFGPPAGTEETARLLSDYEVDLSNGKGVSHTTGAKPWHRPRS